MKKYIEYVPCKSITDHCKRSDELAWALECIKLLDDLQYSSLNDETCEAVKAYIQTHIDQLGA